MDEKLTWYEMQQTILHYSQFCPDDEFIILYNYITGKFITVDDIKKE